MTHEHIKEIESKYPCEKLCDLTRSHTAELETILRRNRRTYLPCLHKLLNCTYHYLAELIVLKMTGKGGWCRYGEIKLKCQGSRKES